MADGPMIIRPMQWISSSSDKRRDGPQPKAGQSSTPTTFKISRDGDLNVPDYINKCHVPLVKVPLPKYCSQYGINYRLLCLDYDLKPDISLISSSEDESDEDTSFQNGEHISRSGSNLRNLRLKKRKKFHYSPPKTQTKRKKVDETSSKSVKTVRVVHEVIPPQPLPIRQNITGKGHNSKGKNKGVLNKKPKVATVAPLVTSNFQNGFEHFSPYQRTSSPINYNDSFNHQTIHNGKNQKRINNFKAKDKYPIKRRNRFISNKYIMFLGENYLERELFDDFCQCENNCELDELSMAFDMLLRSTCDEDLPKDLRISVGFIIQSDDEEYLADDLPSEFDVLREVQKEAQNESQTEANAVDRNELLVDEFLMKTYLNSSVPNVNGLTHSVSDLRLSSQPTVCPSPLVNGNVIPNVISNVTNVVN